MGATVRLATVVYGAGKDRERFTLPMNYIEAARRAGAQVAMLGPGEPDVDSWLDVVDGVLLAGGGDMAPERYGAPEDSPQIYGVDPDRDRSELALVQGAIARGKPLLAICRGLQVLNVARGGTLHPHVPDVFGNAVAHRLEQGAHSIHDVRADNRSILPALCGANTFPVASLHHQAVNLLGDSLEACAWADDGLVEALIIPGNDDVLAVQWHPELTAGSDARQQRLFDWLVDRCSLLE